MVFEKDSLEHFLFGLLNTLSGFRMWLEYEAEKAFQECPQLKYALHSLGDRSPADIAAENLITRLRKL